MEYIVIDVSLARDVIVAVGVVCVAGIVGFTTIAVTALKLHKNNDKEGE